MCGLPALCSCHLTAVEGCTDQSSHTWTLLFASLACYDASPVDVCDVDMASDAPFVVHAFDMIQTPVSVCLIDVGCRVISNPPFLFSVAGDVSLGFILMVSLA